MESNENRPNAALINREWFVAAQQVLPEDGFSRVVTNAVRYVLGYKLAPHKTPEESVAFAMIKPALDSDIEKYRERCIRNAQNAKSRSQRVGASGSEWVRVDANTTTTPTTTTTTTSTSKPSLSAEELRDRERWLIYGYFVCSGSGNALGEFNAFWDYYEGLGWKNNKGAEIVNKLAAARMWRRQFETAGPKAGADAWFKVMQECTVIDYNIWNAYAGAERSEDAVIVRMRVNEAWAADFKAQCSTLLHSLQRLWRVSAIRLERV